MARGLDYSKWNHIDVSDDEDDTHPNIDTPSLFRWRHQARVEKMEEAEKEKKQFVQKKTQHKKEVEEVKGKMKALKTEDAPSASEAAAQLKKKRDELKRKEREIKKEEEELAKKERLTPWNVDTLSKPGFERTIINKKATEEELSEEEKQKKLFNFMDRNETEIKSYGMLKDYNASRDYLRDHPHLVCEDTGSYLTLWCINLAVEEKTTLMERVAHQAIVMQYILEMAKTFKRDPRSVVPAFFERMKSAEKTYQDAFEDELRAFVGRVKDRARVRIEEAMKKAEEEERQQRLGPGGLDPLEVLETLPSTLKECFETRSIEKLEDVLKAMTKEERSYHMKRCVDSGLWVADAKSAGLTPANEMVKDFGKGIEKEEEEDSDEFYEAVDDAKQLGEQSEH